MSLKVWIDGKLYDKADAKLSVYDHGLLYGDGVFEGIRVYHGKIFECVAHIDRLWASARAIRLNIPVSREQMCAAIEETVRANSFKDCYVRAVVTRGPGDLGIDPRKCPRAELIVIARQLTMYAAAVEIGKRLSRESCRCVSCGDDGDDGERKDRIDFRTSRCRVHDE